MEDLAVKTKQLLAELAELEGARALDEVKTDAKDEYEAAARAVADEKALQAAIRKYGPIGKEIHAYKTDAGIAIVRRASALEYRAFQKRARDGEVIEAQSELARECLVHPTLAEYAAIEDRFPIITTHLAGGISILAGGLLEEVAKKSQPASRRD